MTLSQPGAATFVLTVRNTGNVEDEYTATITGTDGPITASLVGLDGRPVQEVSGFRLPGLATGALVLRADQTAAGRGTVTVEVRSRTDGTLVGTDVATVVSGQVTFREGEHTGALPGRLVRG